MFKERPILFQTDMVKAIQEDRKTQTRRDKSLEKLNTTPDRYYHSSVIDGVAYFEDFETLEEFQIASPYGKAGDLLWVRETWHPYPIGLAKYKASLSDFGLEMHKKRYGKWKSPIHMPKDEARIWLMVEDVRVERLHDISQKDAIAEGIKNIGNQVQPLWKEYDKNSRISHWLNPRASFSSLWISINGDESFVKNPWVWVIKFRVLSNFTKPSEEYIEHAREFLSEKKEVQDA